MSFLIFADRAAANARNGGEARRRGAGDASGDETQFWWAAQDHPTDGRCALKIPAQDEASLSDAERGALVSALSSDWQQPLRQ